MVVAVLIFSFKKNHVRKTRAMGKVLSFLYERETTMEGVVYAFSFEM